MATLDRWRPFLSTPKTLSFPQLELIGRDFSPPIVVGSGEVRMPTLNHFEYSLAGVPADLGYFFEAFREQRENPYDGLARFRLRGVDAEGEDWALGWTVPRFEAGEDDEDDWTFTDRLDGLMVDDRSETVAKDLSTELIFVVPVNHPMAHAMGRFVFTKEADGRPLREHVLDAVGSSIRFTYEPSSGTLAIIASHSADLPPTFAENWLGEPLRILFGQLVFPRLVARNFGDGRAMISVRRSPGLIREAAWAALWEADDPRTDKSAFWSQYAGLLTYIVRALDGKGRPNFESNKVTKLYEEIIQASRGSRWVWALTFASSIEGLVRLLYPRKTKRTDVDAAALKSLVKHIGAWGGDKHLKEVAINAVQRTAEFTSIHALRELVNAGVISTDQVSAWETIRNSVSHGSMLSPYSNVEEDGQLRALATMMHALTGEIVRRATSSARRARSDEARRTTT